MTLDSSYRIGVVDQAREKRSATLSYCSPSVAARIGGTRPPAPVAPPKPKIHRLSDSEYRKVIEAAEKRGAEKARKALLDPIRENSPAVKVITDTVCAVTEFTPYELFGAYRFNRVSRARQMAYYLLRELRPELSTPAIGKIMQRDHTTIVHGLQSIRGHMGYQPISDWLADPRIQQLFASAPRSSSSAGSGPSALSPGSGRTP